MGQKRARKSPASAEMTERLVDDLAPLDDVTSRTMFGGHGVFADGVMFALVDSHGGAFLRADESKTSRFEEVRSARHRKMRYWRIPDDLLADADRLLEWTGAALDTPRAAKGR